MMKSLLKNALSTQPTHTSTILMIPPISLKICWLSISSHLITMIMIIFCRIWGFVMMFIITFRYPLLNTSTNRWLYLGGMIITRRWISMRNAIRLQHLMWVLGFFGVCVVMVSSRWYHRQTANEWVYELIVTLLKSAVTQICQRSMGQWVGTRGFRCGQFAQFKLTQPIPNRLQLLLHHSQIDLHLLQLQFFVHLYYIPTIFIQIKFIS